MTSPSAQETEGDEGHGTARYVRWGIQALLILVPAIWMLGLVRPVMRRIPPFPDRSGGHVIDFVAPALDMLVFGLVHLAAVVLLVVLVGVGMALYRWLGWGPQLVWVLGVPALLLGVVLVFPLSAESLEQDRKVAIQTFEAQGGGPASIREGLSSDYEKLLYDERVQSRLASLVAHPKPHRDLIPYLEFLKDSKGSTIQQRNLTIALVCLDIGLRPDATLVRGELLGPSMDRRTTDLQTRLAVYDSLGPLRHDRSRRLLVPPEGIRFDPAAVALLRAESLNQVKRRGPEVGDLLLFSYTIDGFDNPFARAWSVLSDKPTSVRRRTVKEMLTWWMRRSESTPYNSPWASDDDLAALGAALRELRDSRPGSDRKSGNLHLQRLLIAQQNRPGAAPLLDLPERHPPPPPGLVKQPGPDMGPSPGGVTRYSGERRQMKFTRVYTCGEVVKMLSRHSPSEVLVNVKKEKFSERTGDCVEKAGGASPDLIQHIREHEVFLP